ncbi:MAG TPA: YajQ family cyclic di-GMP-binding protein [Polyangia bacterium]
MPSFDVVSKANVMEIDNALNTAQKELAQRYDFRGTNTSLERTPEGIVLRTSDEAHVTSAIQVLRERMAKRNVSQRCLDIGDPVPAAAQSVRVLIKIKQGIETEVGKKINKTIKDSKLKVQSSIQGDEVRVTGKNRGDLQEAIALLKREDFGIDLQFINFRD